MQFITSAGQVVVIDPFSQQSIDAAKAVAPGEGIGPLVAGELISQIANGNITKAEQLPAEYLHLGAITGLKE